MNVVCLIVIWAFLAVAKVAVPVQAYEETVSDIQQQEVVMDGIGADATVETHHAHNNSTAEFTFPSNITAQMARDVYIGLSASPKRLPAHYYYDDKGSEIFRQIMQLDSYYLTNCEYEIFEKQATAVVDILSQGGKPFRLVELGAGDGHKTKLLLAEILHQMQSVTYTPIDISSGAMDTLTQSLEKEMPEVDVRPVVDDYFVALDVLSQEDNKNNDKNHHHHKVVLFVGGGIGNFEEEDAIAFLRAIGTKMTAADRILIGFDLIKDPDVILLAYNDPDGVLRSFYTNLLERFNRELGADFDIDQWGIHHLFDPTTGARKAFYVSRINQRITFSAMDNFTVDMKAWEGIRAALSQKFDEHQIETLAANAGFRVVKNFYDEQRFFIDSIWELL